MVARYLALTLFCGGDVGERRPGFAEDGAMLVEPRRVEVVREVGWLAIVEVDDLLNAELLAVGLDEHRMRRELEPIGVEEHVIGHFRAACRYFVSSAGDIVNDSPELSKPARLAGSTGNSRAGRMSTPVRSRMV